MPGPPSGPRWMLAGCRWERTQPDASADTVVTIAIARRVIRSRPQTRLAGSTTLTGLTMRLLSIASTYLVPPSRLPATSWVNQGAILHREPMAMVLAALDHPAYGLGPREQQVSASLAMAQRTAATRDHRLATADVDSPVPRQAPSRDSRAGASLVVPLAVAAPSTLAAWTRT